MQTEGNDNIRYPGIDILKIIATLMVIVLHVDGYFSQYVNGNINNNARLGFQFLETTAYPAIHIFVLCGSFLMQSRKKIRFKQFIYIYGQMFFVTTMGLLFVTFLNSTLLTKSGIASSLLPFSFRAYGYVSSWIVLMILSPFLNKLQNSLSQKEHGLLIVSVSLPVSIMPTFVFGIWQNDYMSLFVLLYLIAGYAYRYRNCFFSSRFGMILWGGAGFY